MSEAQEQRITKLREQLHEHVVTTILFFIKEILHTKNPCEHAEHRVQPTRFDDWKAVENMMYTVSETLSILHPDYIVHVSMFVQQLVNIDSEEDVKELVESDGYLGREVVMLEAAVKANMHILNFHHQIVAQYGQANSADIHYDRIINMVEQMYAHMAEKIKKVGIDKITANVMERYRKVKEAAERKSDRPKRSAMH